MGGSSSKQEVKAKKPLKNYNEDKSIEKEAANKGVDKSLLAYQRQKTDKELEFELLRNRSKNEKK